MQFTTLFASLASLGLTNAIITGFSVPSTIKPGDGFNLIINTSNYIQSVYDVAVAFGVAPNNGFQGALGQVVDTFYLGPENSNVLHPIPKWVTLPASVSKGKATFGGTFYSLFGASSVPTLTTWNVTVTIGDSTSTKYVTSKP